MKKPTQPKTEEAPESTLPVSDTAPADRFSALPSWLQHELTTQEPVGNRNNHCIKIAPALLREGWSPDETLQALAKLYPGAKPGEIEGVVTRAEVYAQTEREQDPEWQAERMRLEAKSERARLLLPRIVADWQMEDLETELPDLDLREQRRRFLTAMFQPEDVVWIGETQHSGPNYRHHFRSLNTWLNCRGDIPGEFVSHCVFQPGTVHRNTESIAADKYLVLESDLLKPQELAAVAKYLRDFHKLPLHAIVTTGGKRHAPQLGWHYWFAHPGKTYEADWKATLSGYGADIATLRGPQPVRLAGCVRRDTGLPQQLWYLK